MRQSKQNNSGDSIEILVLEFNVSDDLQSSFSHSIIQSIIQSFNPSFLSQILMIQAIEDHCLINIRANR
jgi:hypothetical protein